MAIAENYRGVPYSIPNNADGVWHYKVHPGHLSADAPRPQVSPAEGYASRAAAVAGACRAIDFWLSRRSKD